MSFVTCVVDADYQIFTEFPFQIRRKSNKRIIAENINNTKWYICCYLNRKQYLKHRIIAQQFIPNPENKPFIDHINRIKTDNRIENLRWVFASENSKNKSSDHGKDFEYFDEINEDSMEVREYAGHQLEDYYYDDQTDAFYFWNGMQFRKLTVCYNKRGYALVWCKDIENKRVAICYAKFKKIYGFV